MDATYQPGCHPLNFILWNRDESAPILLTGFLDLSLWALAIVWIFQGKQTHRPEGSAMEQRFTGNTGEEKQWGWWEAARPRAGK